LHGGVRTILCMILILLYQCITGLLAWINYTILRSKGDIGKAMHMANGALHLAAATAIGYFTQWHYGLACLLFTRVVFDTVDQWEKKLVFRIAAIVHKKRTIITDREIEWTAIGFRIFILITATTILFL
jgi:hypothetical protein